MNIRKVLKQHLGALLAVSAALSVVVVSADAAELDRSAARVTHAKAGKPLTAASNASPEAAVAGYLRGHGRASDDVASLRVVDRSTSANGVKHVRMEQEVDGLKVQGAYVKAAANQRGELVQVIDRSVAVSTPAPSRIDALQALKAAMAKVHPNETEVVLRRAGAQGNTTRFDRGAFFYEAPTVTAVVLPLADGQLARGWLVETWTLRKNLLHHTIVDGDGRVLDVEKRTAEDTYNIFAEDPLKGSQTIVSGPGNGNVQSPAGWLGAGAQSTFQISGNNVDAYLDTVVNNQPDKGGTPVTSGDFVAAADLGTAPTTNGNKSVSVQNLFYLNNVIHDTLYRHGFDEVAGNFQVSNFGKGGIASDPVQAEAQDGSGTDNANFATPPDGRSPRMQMFLFTGAGNTHEVVVNSPPGSGPFNAAPAAFGAPLTPSGITGNAVVAVPANGCTAITTPVAGRIVVIDRGTCEFGTKALNAQKAKAIAVIIVNNQGGTTVIPMGPGADGSRVKISALMISQNDGAALKGLSSPNVTLRQLAVLPLQLDSSLDADVVFHEYGHGLSWRMIGGMSGPLAGAIGEGNSDGIAMLIDGDDAIAEYVTSTPNGFRRFPYAGYPLTYGDVTGGEVHNDGEIYAATIWRLIELFPTRRDVLFRYVVEGMNFTPSTPAYEDMRDGILSAVENGATPTDCDLVWQAFAQFGIGVGAQGTVTATGVQITESFQLPDSGTCVAP